MGVCLGLIQPPSSGKCLQSQQEPKLRVAVLDVGVVSPG